jgi:hypothetical protein
MQQGTIILAAESAGKIGNGTIIVSATPFPLRDTIYYQVDRAGDYRQEHGNKD